MRNYFLTVLILIILLSLPSATFASCMVKPSVEDSAEGSSVVFVGTVTKITPAQIASATYSITAKKPKWERYDEKVDLVTFSVSEAFKGVSGETIEIATGADGYAGYKFENGTWLKVGETYLVYAYKREPAGTTRDDITKENYDKDVAKELRAIYKAFPKKLAAEINEFNSKISPYSANVCGRTTQITNAKEELEQIRRIYPEAKLFNTQANTQQVIEHRAKTATLFQRFLSFFGLS